MSMLCTIFRVTPTQIAAILDDPNLVADLLDAPEADLPVQKPKGFFARLFTNSRKSAAHEARPPQPCKLEVIPDSGRYELDKTWHILHYLLTGLTEADVYCGAADSEDERMKELEWLWQTLAELSNFLAETGYAGGVVLVEIG
jgi:hypothetical protein